MRTKAFIIALSVVLCANGLLKAGVIPGRWDKVEAENLGAKFIVTMQSGERIDGFLKSMTAEYLNLNMLDGQERPLRKAEVAKIITADKRMGSLTNGFVIGAASGAAISMIAAASIDDSNPAAVALVGLIYGLIGGAIGVGIDAAVQGRITLYEAPKGKPIN